jgi:hypothetical protein
MAAKLRWDGRLLMLGEVMVGEAHPLNGWRYRVAPRQWSKTYEDEADCRQDLESEVRRLLKDAGVDVE